MGKAQSKRSVDITTEVKKDDVPEEGTGKMGKIEDVDQLKPQVNGDTHHNENEDKEKSAETEGTENEKDLSTEKEQQPPQETAEPKANLESGDDAAVTTPTEDKPVENGNGTDDTLNESKNAAETSTTENGDSSKKPKKEKVKKKWSLRSISFGKKDKQKPPKKEEASTNGECEKVPEEAAEEATKNGDENAAEATSPTDEKSPVATPAENESKDVATPVTEAAAPVVNGSSEPAKEEKPVAEVAPTVIAEEKAPEKVEITTTEEPPKTESAPAADVAPVTESAPAVAPEPAKTEEVPAPAKIEVNAESIQDETKESNAEVVLSTSEQPQQADNDKEEKKIDEENNVKNIDGESAQNLPPPLPCTSPPSQVSVFALSDDNKDNVESEQLPPPPPVEIESNVVEPVLAIQSEAEIPETVANIEAVVEKQSKDYSESEKPSAAIEPTPEVIASSEISTPPPVVEEPASSIEAAVQLTEDAAPSTEVTAPSRVEAVQSAEVAAQPAEEVAAPPAEVAKEEEKSAVKAVEIDSHPQVLPTITLPEHSAINPEQIAETIALIDEVTQEAAMNVASQLEGEASSKIELPLHEQKTSVESETLPTDPSHPEEQTSTVPEQTSTSETSNTVEVVDPNLSKEESVVAQSLPDVVNEQADTNQAPTELIGDHGALAQQPAAIDVSSDVAKDEQKDKIDDIDSTVRPDEKVPVDETKLSTTPPATNACEMEDAPQAPKSKENGFGENHAAETSATESLNGQVDHKSIEEIKSDCSEKLISEPTTELAAGTVEVKE